ncbi:hypothetical protein Pph01_24310 [Planotetraspora phitsanulokensis]|uniref:Uncharacterized protein n=1 Tax=Planotetraspora phitsanulokensis TaxID=575192 RepID=A0A8J3XIB8_9ACTN|nr:hypothetical protein Pph01_24310 [Planotetraspora phitsanulokensis]
MPAASATSRTVVDAYPRDANTSAAVASNSARRSARAAAVLSESRRRGLMEGQTSQGCWLETETISPVMYEE